MNYDFFLWISWISWILSYFGQHTPSPPASSWSWSYGI